MFNLIDAETAAHGSDDFEVALHIPIMPEDKTDEAACQSQDEEQEKGNITFCIIPFCHQTLYPYKHFSKGSHVLFKIEKFLMSIPKWGVLMSNVPSFRYLKNNLCVNVDTKR